MLQILKKIDEGVMNFIIKKCAIPEEKVEELKSLEREIEKLEIDCEMHNPDVRYDSSPIAKIYNTYIHIFIKPDSDYRHNKEIQYVYKRMEEILPVKYD